MNNNQFNTPNNRGTYYQSPQLSNEADMRILNERYAISRKKGDQRKELIITGFVIGAAIVLYLVNQLIAVSALSIFKLDDLYKVSPVFQSCFGIIAVHLFSLLLPFGIMALILRKRFQSPLIPAKKIKSMTVFSWVSVGMVWCLGGNILVSILVNIVKEAGYELTQSETLKPDSAFACVMLAVGTAIIPGIIEEFAMRCCTLGVLRKYGLGFAMFAVSVVFGLLHGNVIQFVYAFFVGLFLAYVTIKTENILPAMLTHALANGLSVIQDVSKFVTTEKMADNILTGVVFFWLGAAVLGIIYLIFKKELLPEKGTFKRAKDDLNSFGVKLLCLVPGFFIPFTILIALTRQTIHKL